MRILESKIQTEFAEDVFAQALARHQATFLESYFEQTRFVPEPEPEPDVRFSGIHREPKPGALPAPGTRFEKPAVVSFRGRNISTGRHKRWGR